MYTYVCKSIAHKQLSSHVIDFLSALSIPQDGYLTKYHSNGLMANRDFLENRNINDGNSLLDLVQNISPDSEDEVNFTDHSLYYNDQNYKECIARSKGALRILNLNCVGLNAKFDNLKIFLSECNNTSFPLHVITLQETHINSISDVQYIELPGYTLVYDLARINTFGGVAIYVHDFFLI